MEYAVWYGGYSVKDLAWLSQAITQLRSNQWKTENPLFFDGTAWSMDTVREKASIALLSALRLNTTVDKLILRNTDFELKASQALDDVFNSNKNLKKISLSRLRCGSRPITISPSMFQNTMLEELHLEACCMPKNSCIAMKKLLLNSTAFRALRLDNVSMESFSWLSAIKTSRSIKCLTLSALNVRETDISKLLAALSLNTSLVIVRIENMSLSESHSHLLAAVLSRNQNLQELSLCNTNLTGTQWTGSLAINSTLEKLDLSYNPLGSDGCCQIVSALRNNTKLVSLRLRSTQIDFKGSDLIAQDVADLKSVQQLILDGNEILSPCAWKKSLLSNKILHTIFEDPPNIHSLCTDHEWQEVDFYLRLNRANRRLLGNFASMSDPSLPSFLENAGTQGMDVLFYFVQHLPTAVSHSAARSDTPSPEPRLPSVDMDITQDNSHTEMSLLEDEDSERVLICAQL